MHAHTQTRVTTHACRSKRVCAPLCEHRCMCEHVYTCVYTHAHSFAPSFTVVLWYSKMKNSNPVQLSPKSMWWIYHSFLSRKLLLRGYVINMLRGGRGDYFGELKESKGRSNLRLWLTEWQFPSPVPMLTYSVLTARSCSEGQHLAE